jgi:NAD-dependent deacetylase
LSGSVNRFPTACSAAEVFLVVGTSAVVYPAASLVPYARQGGAKVIEVNTGDTQFTNLVDCALRGPAGGLLPELVR